MSELRPDDLQQRAKLRPDDDEPDVEGHVLSPVEKVRLNPDVDEPGEDGELRSR
jgi:hypothetical protein